MCLGLPGGERARLAFDSRRPPKLGQHGLAQRLIGREVEVSRPPTWNEIGQLAAIVVLNYFLQAEIDKAEARRAGPEPG